MPELDPRTDQQPSKPSPRWSVVIPAHGRTTLLRRAIASACEQEQVVEILVVDDLGDEDTKKSVEEIAASSGPVDIRYLRFPRSGGTGPSQSRNYGAASTRCDWVAFLDDDDEWLPGYLEKVEQALAAASDASVCLSWGFIQGTDGTRHDGVSPTASDLRSSSWMRNPGVSGSNFVISRALFGAVGGYDERLGFAEDLELLLRCRDAGATIAINPTRSYVYHAHDQGHLSSRTERHFLALRQYRRVHREQQGRDFTFRDLRLYYWYLSSAGRGPWRPPILRALSLAAQVVAGFPMPLWGGVWRRVSRRGAIVGDSSTDVA